MGFVTKKWVMILMADAEICKQNHHRLANIPWDKLLDTVRGGGFDAFGLLMDWETRLLMDWAKTLVECKDMLEGLMI